MRTIDADELKKMFPDKGEGAWTYNITAKAYIDAAPTVDQWHYPSKGEYPEPDERDICMCLKKFGWHGSTYRTSEIGYWSGKGFVDQRANEIKDEVVAWQYIEPPKEEA